MAPTELIGTNTKYLDYGNKTITPGFSDVHCFFTGYSVGFVGIDLSAATSQEDILNSIKEEFLQTNLFWDMVGTPIQSNLMEQIC